MDLLHCGGCGKNDPQIPEQIMVIGYLKCLISDLVRNWNCSKPFFDSQQFMYSHTSINYSKFYY